MNILFKIHYSSLQYVLQCSKEPAEGDIELYFACCTQMKNATWKTVLSLVQKSGKPIKCHEGILLVCQSNESVKASIQNQGVPGHGGAGWDPETSRTPWEAFRQQFEDRSHRGLWSEMLLHWDLLTIVWYL